MGGLSTKILLFMTVCLFVLSLANAYLINTFINNAHTAAPVEGTGKVAVDIINPKTASNPVTGSGVVSLNIEPLNK